ncbi:type I-E CRISPR-associated protein Cas7/Cse4/CasC [Heliobacterium undosum]|uniref:Type I-E CRISPR-associated protein Cas7/Cse4/CasC n=1 Tax=Heliomicrobium undosum TaxID=121734 RepID=A0A845L9I4_9FIRM|nr:type I-E CRISPR-associated protein Cas7/Cse4/CasC [Heliomicrobium undosum]MZP30368.1 type I-E CRISPR-associated protein Cas7/Cse4/CasC [Heliomicrobium undosum]
MKIECHVLQNFAPSCLNRDDTNTPKMCEFGGVPRARVSSQSWKRAIRNFFVLENSIPIGFRTKRLVEKVKTLTNGEISDETVTQFISAHYSKMDDKRTDETAVLLFISESEIEAIVQCLRDGADKKTATERLKKARLSADIAMFGRMVAEVPERKIDAACQVAHAISTHRVNMETDFFSAMDDLQQTDETGAGMLGIQGYNSACFYRYSLIDVNQLEENLKGDQELALQSVREYLRAFCLAFPSGKQTVMTAYNPPSFVLFIVRNAGVPVSLANAFVKPVRTDDLVSASIDRLVRYHDQMNKVYGLYQEATQAVVHDRDDQFPLHGLSSAKKDSFDKAVNLIVETVRRERA